MDRALTRPSDVTSELKTDANAGTTAASGFGDPAPCLVNKVEVAATPPNAVVGESGLIRYESGSSRGDLGEGSDMVFSPCAARQSRPVSVDLKVMLQRAGTKGLRGSQIAICNRRPRQEMCGRDVFVRFGQPGWQHAARGGFLEEQPLLAAD